MNALLVICIAAILALASPAADADMVMRDEMGNSVVITSKFCTDPDVLKHIKPQYHTLFGQGRAVVLGKKHSLCFWPGPNGSVALIFDDGELGEIPIQSFKKKREF